MKLYRVAIIILLVAVPVVMRIAAKESEPPQRTVTVLPLGSINGPVRIQIPKAKVLGFTCTSRAGSNFDTCYVLVDGSHKWITVVQ